MENEKSVRSVEATGKQRRTITVSYLEDVTRTGTVASAGSRVNVSRGKARRKLCREGTRLGAWDARKIWDGRGITGRKSRDNRSEIGPTVKNVGFLKVNSGRTVAEESRIKWRIIVRTIEVRISELPSAVCSLLVAVVESEEDDVRTDDRRWLGGNPRREGRRGWAKKRREIFSTSFGKYVATSVFRRPVRKVTPFQNWSFY